MSFLAEQLLKMNLEVGEQLLEESKFTTTGMIPGDFNTRDYLTIYLLNEIRVSLNSLEVAIEAAQIGDPA